MATDFENMDYEAVPKSFRRIKMAAELDYWVHEAVRPNIEFKMAADFESIGNEVVPKIFV